MEETELIGQLPGMPPRAATAHKGNFGHVLIVAGSRGMSGAACLAGLGALRGGAGLVRVATPSGVWPAVAAAEPSYLTCPLPEDDAGRIADAAMTLLSELAVQNHVLAIGPGLGQSEAVRRVVVTLLRSFGGPIVLDADALNVLAGQPEGLAAIGPQVVITPHPGEFARLLDTDTKAVQAQRRQVALQFSRRYGNVTVLKGHGTVVTDGQRLYVNQTGNPGMATGGSGDVLTGLLAGLAAQGLPPFEAAVLAVYLHGLAGDLAARQLGQNALIASDLVRFLPRALRTVERRR